MAVVEQTPIPPYTGPSWFPYTNSTRNALLPFLTPNRIGAIRVTSMTSIKGLGKHLITLVQVNIGNDILKPDMITVKFSNLLTSPEDAKIIGPELCRRASIGKDLALLKALRKREWEWDVMAIIDGDESCAHWAYIHGCPKPANVSYDELRKRNNIPVAPSKYTWY